MLLNSTTTVSSSADIEPIYSENSMWLNIYDTLEIPVLWSLLSWLIFRSSSGSSFTTVLRKI